MPFDRLTHTLRHLIYNQWPITMQKQAGIAVTARRRAGTDCRGWLVVAAIIQARMGLLAAVKKWQWDWPVVTALASLLESLNPEMPFDASPPSQDEYLSR